MNDWVTKLFVEKPWLHRVCWTEVGSFIMACSDCKDNTNRDKRNTDNHNQSGNTNVVWWLLIVVVAFVRGERLQFSVCILILRYAVCIAILMLRFAVFIDLFTQPFSKFGLNRSMQTVNRRMSKPQLRETKSSQKTGNLKRYYQQKLKKYHGLSASTYCMWFILCHGMF